MKHILAPIFALVLLFPSLALGDTVDWDGLVERDGLWYERFTNVPFTGEVMGQGQGQIKDGKQEGPWVWYDPNGQLLAEGDYKDGKEDGPWVWYWDNGQLLGEGDYKDGKEDGPWVSYNEDGTKNDEVSGTYRNGVKVSD
jgi:hypothetical protein